MGISLKDSKLLFAKAAGQCSQCKRQLMIEPDHPDDAYLLAEQAHIVGEKPGSPRGESRLTDAERNSYPNLILLCPTCHTQIDTNVNDYPVDRLYVMKIQHEQAIAAKIQPAGSAETFVWLLTLIKRTDPLLVYLHNDVSPNQSMLVLEHLYQWWLAPILPLSLPNMVRSALDYLQRPLLNTDFPAGQQWHYGASTWSKADQAFERLCTEHFGYPWTVTPFNDHDSWFMLTTLSLKLRELHVTNGLPPLETCCLHYAMSYAHYALDCLHAQRHLPIPKRMLDSFFALVDKLLHTVDLALPAATEDDLHDHMMQLYQKTIFD
ncbi:hypothetical protein [Herpetosiphon gulosus]|uniref:HNH endonuclease n=1 Tax=Herpetosiphon gulosus TaxID=1973496 RepID=A0ABP9X6P2_9CHLR